MKIIFQYILTILSSTILCACNLHNRSLDHSNLAIIDFQEIPDSMTLTDHFQKIRCIQLEMTEESIIGKIKRIVALDSQIVVLIEDNEIFVFNKEDGKFIRQFGSTGEGSEEFLIAQDISYNPIDQTIMVLDSFSVNLFPITSMEILPEKGSLKILK